MSESISTLPELVGSSQFVRIPPELDVPLTARVRAVLDTPAMQRLKEISQLGLVSLVYPGAIHSRFEHSLGVYRLALQVLKHLTQTHPDWAMTVEVSDVKVFLLAALLHDVGHWPYCHPIEDMRLRGSYSA
ncbi:MAG: HD domain-containing protein [Pirellulales bacterium]